MSQPTRLLQSNLTVHADTIYLSIHLSIHLYIYLETPAAFPRAQVG